MEIAYGKALPNHNLMNTVFYTIISDSHYAGCRTNEFIASFKHFHPDIYIVVFAQGAIDKEFKANPNLTFYNCKAHFAKILYNDFDLVVNIDADHLILGTLDSILAADYDVACPANYNVFSNASLKIVSTGNKVTNLVPEERYYQGGLIASTSKQFWDAYDYASMKHSHSLHYAENDVLNLILSLCDYNVKYLDGDANFKSNDFHSYYGCASLGQERLAIIDNGQIKINGKPIKAYHFAKAGINKPPVNSLFSKEVTEFIYSKIINNNNMLIAMKQADGKILDLSGSEKFKAHYLKGNTYAKYIIDNEINDGQWYDSLFDDLPEDAVVVDVGANVGLFAAYLNNGKRKFYCVEPTTSHIQIAAELFQKINCDASIWGGVIYNKNGTVNLFEEASNSTMNRVSAKGRSVPSMTLKSFFDAYKLDKVDLLKLDIESAEQQVILEDPTVDEPLRKCSMVFIEVHPQDGFGNKVNVDGIIDKLKSLGFVHKEGGKPMAHYFFK